MAEQSQVQKDVNNIYLKRNRATVVFVIGVYVFGFFSGLAYTHLLS